MKKLKTWFREKVSTRVLVVILILFFAADIVSVFATKKPVETPAVVESQAQVQVQALAPAPVPTEDKAAYIKQLENSVAEAQRVNKQWVNAQANWEKMQVDYQTQITTLKTEKNELAKKMVQGFQSRINNLSMNMTDPGWDGSLLNNVSDIVADVPSDLREVDRKIALVHVYSWAGVGVCSVLDDYVKAGFISSRGESCESRAFIASQIK